jgi:hypothetical protein
MRLRTLAAAAGLTLALGLAIPKTAVADHCGRSYGYSSYGYRAPYAHSPYRASVYPPVYSPYAYTPYAPYYAPVYRPAYVVRPAPVVVYRRPIRRPHVSIRIGF